MSASPFDLKLTYISSLIYPGISTGMEFPLNRVNSQLQKKHKCDSTFTRARFISGNFNWYHHPDFQDNLYITAEWVMQRTRTSGFISEFSAGPGFSRTFLGGTTYRADEKGSVTVVKLAGYYYALITIGGGFGYDLSYKKLMPFSVIAKMDLISMFPYNSTIYIRPVMEIGIRYAPRKSKPDGSKEGFVISE